MYKRSIVAVISIIFIELGLANASFADDPYLPIDSDLEQLLFGENSDDTEPKLLGIISPDSASYTQIEELLTSEQECSLTFETFQPLDTASNSELSASLIGSQQLQVDVQGSFAYAEGMSQAAEQLLKGPLFLVYRFTHEPFLDNINPLQALRNLRTGTYDLYQMGDVTGDKRIKGMAIGNTILAAFMIRSATESIAPSIRSGLSGATKSLNTQVGALVSSLLGNPIRQGTALAWQPVLVGGGQIIGIEAISTTTAAVASTPTVGLVMHQVSSNATSAGSSKTAGTPLPSQTAHEAGDWFNVKGQGQTDALQLLGKGSGVRFGNGVGKPLINGAVSEQLVLLPQEAPVGKLIQFGNSNKWFKYVPKSEILGHSGKAAWPKTGTVLVRIVEEGEVKSTRVNVVGQAVQVASDAFFGERIIRLEAIKMVKW